jgi:hypothetical protein
MLIGEASLLGEEIDEMDDRYLAPAAHEYPGRKLKKVEVLPEGVQALQICGIMPKVAKSERTPTNSG